MLIELTQLFMGKEKPVLINPQHIATIAHPHFPERDGRETTYIDMVTGNYYHVLGVWEEIKAKWEGALRDAD